MHASSEEKQQKENNPELSENEEAVTAESGNDSAAGKNGSNGSSEADSSGTDNGGERELASKIKGLEEELSELKNQYLRKQADFENFRKRMLREKEEFAQFANRQLMLDLIPIIDDFERAIKSAEESRDFDSFHDGIVLIEKQFTSMLERKWGLKRFDSDGEEFDPQKHEAVMTEEDPEHETSVVLEDYQKGYMLHDKVLRSAKVKVSMPVTDENR